jgi:hypothetical protein
MEVLAAAGGVALEDALGVCEERGMVAEQVGLGELCALLLHSVLRRRGGSTHATWLQAAAPLGTARQTLSSCTALQRCQSLIAFLRSGVVSPPVRCTSWGAWARA